MPRGRQVMVQWEQGEEEIYRNVFWFVLFTNSLVVFVAFPINGGLQYFTVILTFCPKQQAKIGVL